MENYSFLIIILVLLLVIAYVLSSNITTKQEQFSNSSRVCSYKQNQASGVGDIYAKNVDKNIVIPQRYLDGQSENISGYINFTSNIYAPIYDIGEIDVFSHPNVPLGVNSSGRPNNNDYNQDIKG